MELSYLLYEGIEPIDLAALGVISMGRRIVPQLSYRTLAATKSPVELSNGLRVLPDATFDEVREVDVLMVPGGPGWKRAARDPDILAFIRRWSGIATICSICTGAMILAAARTLDGLTATTKSIVVPPEESPLDELRASGQIRAVDALLVDNGRVITGGGVTLCIDTTLYLIGLRYGEAAAAEVARIMEYGAARAANASRLPSVVQRALEL